MTDAPAVDLGDAGATSDASARAPLPVVDPGPKIRPFDFFHKETVDRARMHLLSGLLESIGHRFSSAASAEIRQSVRIVLNGDEPALESWEQYCRTLPETTFLSSATALQLDGRLVLHVPTAIALELLDFYFGGDAERLPDRALLTDLEREIFAAVVEVLWEALPSAFGGLMELSIGAIQYSTNALRLQAIHPNETCLVFACTVTVNDRDPHRIELVAPFEVIDPIINRLEEQQLAELKRSAGDSADAIERLDQTPTEIRISYPPVQLSAEDLFNLVPGKVVTLKEGISPPPVQVVTGDTVIAVASVEQDENPMICRILSLEVAR